jgi:FHA domain
VEQLTTHIGIEPGHGLVGRFGDTAILIPRDEAAGPDEAIRELLDLAAVVATNRQAPASAIAARLAGWVIGRMSQGVPAFGIVAPVRDGVVMFLRGAVWCTVTDAGGATRDLSGEQALTWVDQIVPGTFERLTIGSADGQPVQADPLSDLRDGVVPGQGFVLTRMAGAAGQGAARDEGVSSQKLVASEAVAVAAEPAAVAPGAEAGAAEAGAAEAGAAEAGAAEAGAAEAGAAEAGGSGPLEQEADAPEAVRSGPVEPGIVAPEAVRSGPAEPGIVAPEADGPGLVEQEADAPEAEPAEPEPAEAEAALASPDEAESGLASPDEAESGLASPVQAEAEPAEARTVEAGTVEAEAASGLDATGADRFAWSAPADTARRWEGGSPEGTSPDGQPQHPPTMLAQSGSYGEAAARPQPAPTMVTPVSADPGPPAQPASATPPTLGTLTSDSGLVIVLDRGYVLGREPHLDPAVANGDATPVKLQDPDSVISRVHAYVIVDGGILLIRDIGSLHGTYVSPPGANEWTRIGLEPTPLPPGWNMRIGEQVFTFQRTGPGDEW